MKFRKVQKEKVLVKVVSVVLVLSLATMNVHATSIEENKIKFNEFKVLKMDDKNVYGEGFFSFVFGIKSIEAFIWLKSDSLTATEKIEVPFHDTDGKGDFHFDWSFDLEKHNFQYGDYAIKFIVIANDGNEYEALEDAHVNNKLPKKESSKNEKEERRSYDKTSRRSNSEKKSPQEPAIVEKDNQIEYTKAPQENAKAALTPPVISNMGVVRNNGEQYTIEADISNDNEVNEILAPTWTLANGQDDLVWGKATVANGKATYTVDMKDHRYELGDYATQFVVKNKDGSESLATIIQKQVAQIPVIKNVKVTSGAGKYTVEADVDSAYGIGKVEFPTWTLANGQDDLVWGKGTVIGNKISYTVDMKDHKFEVGKYVTQIIVYDKTGSSSSIGQVIQDITNDKPVISNMRVVNNNGGKFTVEADVSDDYGLDKVLVPTWTLANGQDDLVWGEATIANGKATYTVDMKDHHYELGDYATQFVAHDKAGLESIATVIQKQIAQPPVLKNVKVTSSAGKYTVDADVDSAYGIGKVQFPTWTLANGQDDLVWGKGTITGNKISYTVDMKDHKFEVGKYVTQIIVYDKTGSSSSIGQVFQDIVNDPPIISNMRVVSNSGEKYTVEADVSDDYGLDKVLVPTWTLANGQDDLVWGEATIANGKATYTVDMKDHHYELGDYATQFVAHDKAGLESIATVIQKQGAHPPVIKNVKVTSSAGRYTVEADVDSTYGIGKVEFPTWTLANGQDDLVWGKGTITGNKISYTVDMKDHKFEVGKYVTQIFVSDKTGTSSSVGQVIQEITNQPPVVTNMRVVSNNGDKYTIEADVSDDYGLDKVLVPTWTLANGQDDLVWGEATVVNGKATYTVDMKDHHYELGDYATQFVVRDMAGAESVATLIQSKVAQPPVIKNVKVTVSPGKYTVEAEVDSTYGIGKVEFPTWTLANGQDDLVWGKGTISGNKVSYTAFTQEHNFEEGKYVTQIIAYDKTGTSSIGEVIQDVKNDKSVRGWKVINGQKYLFNKDGNIVNGAKKLVIDVSEHNGNIDWNSVKAAGVDGVILRVGYGWSDNLNAQRDKTFNRNANELERLGIPYGVYLFSYENSASGAVREAQYTLDLIKGRKISLPVYYDLEYDDYVGNLSQATYVAMAKAYCDKIRSAGYTPGIYANLNYWDTKLNDSSLDQYSKWVAQYNANDGSAGYCEYTKSYRIWQYTSVGKVSGIGNNVDMNAWYGDF